MEGGEVGRGKLAMPRRRKRDTTLSDLKSILMAIAGFLFIAFGLLLLLLPANYPISTLPTAFNPLLGIVLIVLGVYLLVRGMD